MKKIRWGILSTGTIAKNFCETAARMNGEIEITAIASRSLEKARALADAYGVALAYGSYEELAIDPTVDIVYVATPHSRHCEDMLLLLSHGKHILCEKSFTINAREARRVYAYAQEKGLLVLEAFWTKFLPIYRAVEQRIASGAIGRVRLVTAQYGYTTAREARKFDPALAGGALLDIGVYCIGFAAMILGYHPDAVDAQICLNAVGTDSWDAITLRYGEAAATLTAAIGVQIPVHGAVYGTLGRIEIPEFKNPQAFEMILDHGGRERYELSFNVNGYEYQMREAQACLMEGRTRSDILTPEQSIAVMDMMDEARRKGRFRFSFEKA